MSLSTSMDFLGRPLLTFPAIRVVQANTFHFGINSNTFNPASISAQDIYKLAEAYTSNPYPVFTMPFECSKSV